MRAYIICNAYLWISTSILKRLNDSVFTRLYNIMYLCLEQRGEKNYSINIIIMADIII